ncbi:unnamed protein product, partial [marine sediment metagenome]
MVDWVQIGAGLGFFSFIGLLVLIYYAFKGWEMLNATPEIDTAAVYQELLTKDPARLTQLASVTARAENTANKNISRDLIENSPFSMILSFFDEDTIEHLQEHPEALPGVLKKWAPVIEAVANTPLGQTLLGGMQQQRL